MKLSGTVGGFVSGSADVYVFCDIFPGPLKRNKPVAANTAARNQRNGGKGYIILSVIRERRTWLLSNFSVKSSLDAKTAQAGRQQ